MVLTTQQDLEHVMVMGIPGSGSTLVTNLLQELRNYRIRRYDYKHNIGKTHGYTPQLKGVGICTYRDFRDGFLSVARRRQGDTLQEKCQSAWDAYVHKGFFNIEDAPDDDRVTMMRYEDYLPHDVYGLMKNILEPVVKIQPLGRGVRQKLATKYDVDKIKTNVEPFGFRRFGIGHVTHNGLPGAWRELLPQLEKDLLAKLVELTIPLLITFGYEKDDSWVALLGVSL